MSEGQKDQATECGLSVDNERWQNKGMTGPDLCFRKTHLSAA